MALSQKFVDVVLALAFRDGRLLISKRKAGTHLGGFWEFPGGKRERGESDAETLLRELREEVGLEAQVHSFYRETTHSYPDRRVRLRFMICQVAAGADARALQVAELKWVSKAELEQYPFPEGNHEILRCLAAEDWTRFCF